MYDQNYRKTYRTSKPLKTKLLSVAKLLDDYENDWNDFTLSSICFLNENEINFCEWIKLTLALTGELSPGKYTSKEAGAIANKTYKKLLYKKRYFHQWKQNKLLTERGFYKENTSESFLTAPLYTHKGLSIKTCNALNCFDNFKELIDYGIDDLKIFRGIGKKAIEEIKQLYYLHQQNQSSVKMAENISMIAM